MIFNSLTFLVFLGAVLAVHRLPLRWPLRKLNLLLASYLFYAAWNPPFVILLWISTLVDWFAAGRMHQTDRPAVRRGYLLLSLTANLGLLSFFKYGGFLLDNFVLLLAGLGLDYRPPPFDFILPVGISFYTFQTLSYTIDVYRRKMQPWPSFLDFALFVTFFPQLVAGPIVRAADFLPQCREPRRATSEQMGWGLALLTIGLFEKVILADKLLAPVADRVYNAPELATRLDAWVGTLAFSGQIFFDFAGYSSCAIGGGLCLGFVLPRNFRYPYAAIGFSDFWRRWHISLSSWLRDYLYVPLGGNRLGPGRTQVNLMATMLLGGLWHGAAWRFVVWGGLHGLYLMGERVVRGLWGDRWWVSRWYTQFGLLLLTHFLVLVTWVFFRATDFSSAFVLLGSMLVGEAGWSLVNAAAASRVLALTVALLTGHWLLRNTSLEAVWNGWPWWARSMALAAALLAMILAPGVDRAFIYFQF